MSLGRRPSAPGGESGQQAQASSSRHYLDIQPLSRDDIPQHRDLDEGPSRDHDNKARPTLLEFLTNVLVEAYQIDFDDDSWTQHGTYPSDGLASHVTMPSLLPTTTAPESRVPILVDKRAKGKTSSAWLARRSHHNMLDLSYQELDSLLSQDHCRKEGDYDPSVFDANELVKWDAEELDKAVAELRPEWRVKKVQMAVYQMFHEMPKVVGAQLLQDRVFHVLAVTAHSTCSPSAEGESAEQSQSHTLQLPVDWKSFRGIEALQARSHLRLNSLTYDIGGRTDEHSSATVRQQKHSGKSVTEGVYVSVERLRQAPNGPKKDDQLHRWDMMTRSDAMGISRLAPWSTKRKETLGAIAKDVEYVIEEVKKQRLAKGNGGHTTQ